MENFHRTTASIDKANYSNWAHVLISDTIHLLDKDTRMMIEDRKKILEDIIVKCRSEHLTTRTPLILITQNG